ncbi:glycosyltransferase family 4 protein [Polaribacter staleyi]|uniref:glycosyltransferase family 4 protein n=1 Tax=Polaribacter staleyi TaxID=2022337 RepID=UPI0031BADFF2
MRICITRTLKHGYSETFIRDQIKVFFKLTKNVYTIHSGRFPERKEDGTLLSPKFFWVLHKFVKVFVGRNNFFSNYGVKKYLKENNINVVLSNYGISAAHMVPVCRELKIPLIVIFHGHDATDKKLLKEYKSKYQKLFNYASSIVVVSKEMQSDLITLGARKEKIVVVPCGVNTLKFMPEFNKIKERNFIAVGRFTEKKGPLITIRAFYSVLQKYPDVKLTMVGKKDGLYNDCEALVKELGIEKSIVFTGILQQNEVAELMKSSLAFVQHSVTASNGDMEGTPVSIMEASASGLPIISTFHGGIKDVVIHGETGFLVSEKDEVAMAKYIMEFCDNPGLSTLFGENGRKHIQINYEQQTQIKKIFDLANTAIRISD